MKIPRDTRLLEFASGWAMLLTAFFMPFELIASNTYPYTPVQGGVLFIGLAGFLHLVTLYKYEHADILRATLCFVGGLFWTWLAVLQFKYPTTTTFAAYTIGFGNYLAFIVNALAARESWNQ
jgi:hypothetical protein